MIDFAKVKSGSTAKESLWAAYSEFGDRSVDALVEAYFPLARKALERISMRLPAHVATEDLFQAALLGLYKAIVAFQPQRGIPFDGYAYPRIRGAILDELRSNDSLSRGKRSQVDKVEKVICEWMQKTGEMPSSEEIAGQLGMDVPAFNQLMDEAKPWCSLDSTGTDELPLHETIADPNGCSEEVAIQHDRQEMLRAGFRHLEMREQKILYLYYFEELRLSEIAALFNLTEARISQIHSLAVVRLRAAISSDYPSDFAA